MDVFKLVGMDGSLSVDGEGELINGLSSKMWIERYRQSGEFTLVADVSSGVQEKLPEGSLISHTGTNEIMIVENHQIKDPEDDSEAKVVITGRGLETFLEQRIIGANRVWPALEGTTPISVELGAGYSGGQAFDLLNQYNQEVYLTDDDDYVASLLPVCHSSLAGFPGTAEARVLDRKDSVYKALLDVLAVDDLGIKVVRPRPAPTSHSDFEATYRLKIMDHVGFGQWPNFFWRCGDSSSMGSGGTRSSYALEADVLENQYKLIRRNASGVNTLLTLVSGTLDGVSLNGDTTWRWYRVQMIGTTMKARWWHEGTEEPSEWMIEATDGTYTNGVIGIAAITSATTGSFIRHRYDNLVISPPNGDPIFFESWTGADYDNWSAANWTEYTEASAESWISIQDNSGEFRAGKCQIVAYINGIPYTMLLIHKGVDKSGSVSFSDSAGDIGGGDYLWSIKKLKTSAYVSGKWVEAIVHGPEVGYDRRTLFVDASDLDDNLATPPTGSAWTSLVDKMVIRGRQALAAQKRVSIASVKIVPGSSKYEYRKDYNVGDLVSVYGKYDTSSVMRVTEHVEIEDEFGNTSYPTLSAIDQ